MAECKHECELGALKQFCDSQADLNKAIFEKLEKIDGDLNDGLKTDVAVIKKHCQDHDENHKGLTVRTAVLALLFLVPVFGVVVGIYRSFAG